MQKFPLAVIGAGVIGRTHIERILKTPEFTLVGVAEPGEAGRHWWRPTAWRAASQC